MFLKQAFLELLRECFEVMARLPRCFCEIACLRLSEVSKSRNISEDKFGRTNEVGIQVGGVDAIAEVDLNALCISKSLEKVELEPK